MMRISLGAVPYVFDDIAVRTLEGGSDYVISAFDYLNESKRVEAERVRSLVEDFMSQYPESGLIGAQTPCPPAF
jgi:hypothetical protein